MNEMAPRSYQERLAREVAAILAEDSHAYLEAPTGTGKTLVIGLIAQEAGFADVVYTVHERDLVKQTQREISALTFAGLLDPKIRWHFMTWQRYARLAAHAEAELPQSEHLAIVDECHMGGVRRTNTPKIAFPAIKANATKVVWVSATPWQLDETIMGVRAGHTAYYSYADAYDTGLLNATELVRVDCSLDMHLQFHKDNYRAREFFRRETAPLNIKGITADATFEQLATYVKDCAKRRLRTTDVPALVAYRWRLMAELYLKEHKGEKAIFWLTNQNHARACADYLNQAAGAPNFSHALLGEPKNSVEEQLAEQALTEWRDPNGATTVACVVYRLREGFDYPQLALGFDCAWNPYNYRSTVQKVGRLVRRAAVKAPGRYYYAVDAVSIAAASRSFAQCFLDRLEQSYQPDAMAISAEALADAMELDKVITGEAATEKVRPVVERHTVRGAPVLAARIPLFDVLRADGVTMAQSVSLHEMFKPKAAEQIETFVAEIIAGEKPWPGVYGRDRESNMLRPYLSPSHPSYRPDLRKRLIDAGILITKDGKRDAAGRKIEATLRLIEAGEAELKPGTPAYTLLFKYFNPTNKTFRPEVRERLIATGALIPRNTRANAVDRKINEYITRIERGELSFAAAKREYPSLAGYVSPKSRSYRPETRARLIKAGVRLVKDTS